jgi:hypothetical protein
MRLSIAEQVKLARWEAHRAIRGMSRRERLRRRRNKTTITRTLRRRIPCYLDCL